MTEALARRSDSSVDGVSPRDEGWWADVPTEVSQRVFALLAPADLGRASLVSRRWHALAIDEWVWQRVYRRTYGGPLPKPGTRKTRGKTKNGKQKSEKEEEEEEELTAAGASDDTSQDTANEADHQRSAHQMKEGEQATASWRKACIQIEKSIPRGEYSSLQWACANGHHRFVARRLRESKEFNEAQGSVVASLGRTIVSLQLSGLLGIAIANGHANAVRLLLRHGANPNTAAAGHNPTFTLIDLAFLRGNLDVIEVLLGSGHIADPCKHLVQLAGKKRRGSLAHQVAAKGHVRLMEALIAMTAASGGSTLGQQREAVTSLLAETDSRGYAPLHHAAELGHSGMIELLARSGANVDQFSRRSLFTPLALAIMNLKVDAVSALIKSGASLGPLMIPEALRAEAGGAGKQAFAAIHLACSTFDIPIIEMLLATGRTDINARLSNSRTPLLVALKMKECKLSAIRLIVERFGADVHARDDNGQNAWHYLCIGKPTREKVSIMPWLLAKNVEIPVMQLESLLQHFMKARLPDDDATTAAAKMVKFLWHHMHKQLDEKQRYQALLYAARCPSAILTELLNEAAVKLNPEMGIISPEVITRVLARAVTRRIISSQFHWGKHSDLVNVQLLVSAGADVNATVNLDDDDFATNEEDELPIIGNRGDQPICFRVAWFDFKMMHLLRDLGADLRTRNAMGDTLLAHYLRPTTTACSAAVIPSSDPTLDGKDMARFISWLAHLTRQLHVDSDLTSCYGIDFDRPEYSRWPSWAKVLIRSWVTNPTQEFPWAHPDSDNWPRYVFLLAGATNQPLW